MISSPFTPRAGAAVLAGGCKVTVNEFMTIKNNNLQMNKVRRGSKENFALRVGD